ncbi:hypothetical protein [Arcticibacter sp. MXS-1]|uniref:hypothetical protein n=1 Tax=Arcticibacter sp. MXS-1 TaxID=3341726 RepID=UPI0035A83594
MENKQNAREQAAKSRENEKDNTIGGAQTNRPDAAEQNDTGYAGTTNSLSENQSGEDGYKIAIEDTIIGYDGHEDQMDMDLGEEDRRRSGKSGAGDND